MLFSSYLLSTASFDSGLSDIEVRISARDLFHVLGIAVSLSGCGGSGGSVSS